MSVHGRKAADEALVLALACGATVESAAQKAKVSKRTAYRRLKDTKFAERIRALRVDMRQRMSGALTAAGMGAIKTLLALLEPTIPPAVRLGAARALVDLGHKAHLLNDLEERLAALEHQVAGTSPVSGAPGAFALREDNVAQPAGGQPEPGVSNGSQVTGRPHGRPSVELSPFRIRYPSS